MKVLVTGSTGFVGRQVVLRLLERGHEIIATARSPERAVSCSWFKDVNFIEYDLKDLNKDIPMRFREVDAVIHLGWQGLPNYRSLFHFEQTLPSHYHFLKSIVSTGVKQVLVAGTCFEYGVKNGPLDETMLPDPANSYALAKDSLRRFLEILQQNVYFRLKWVRLFYIYGPDQKPGTLLGQLDQAIDQGETKFNMTNGEQLRDYLPVEEVARRIVFVLEDPGFEGIINCCSGYPISVRRLVEQRISDRGANIKLQLGYYPYPDYEPMAFWGTTTRFNRLESLKNL